MGYALRVIFVPVGEQAENLDNIKDYYQDDYDDNIQYQDHAAFAAIGAEDSADFETFDLSNDSKQFGEAIAIQVTTYGDDYFFYDHWLNGECVRSLQYDPYSGWLTVQGMAESWEKTAFFKPNQLEQDLHAIETNEYIKEKVKRIAELKQLIAERQLIESYRYPVITGEGVLFELIEHFKLFFPNF